MPRSKRRPTALALESLEARALLSLTLEFDYSLDKSGFFSTGDNGRKTVLESTLTGITNRLRDSLPSVSSWDYSFEIGDSGTSVTKTTSVSANTLKLYVYGAPLNGSTLARGGSYFSETNLRGGNNDFAPDVSYLMFDNDGSSNWYFGASEAGLTSSKVDFVSVATHEFLHALGFLQSNPAFSRYKQGSTFVGPNARAAHGGTAVPLNGSHIDEPSSVMFWQTTTGTRTPMHDLEWAMLKDFGWSVGDPPTANFVRWTLFSGGEGGNARVRVDPAKGVYMLRFDALAGDTMTATTSDGTLSNEKGVDTFLKLYDANGNGLTIDDDGGVSTKSLIEWTFPTGGTYYLGASTFNQSDFTFASPTTQEPGSNRFFVDVSLVGKADAEPDSPARVTSNLALGGTGQIEATLTDGDRDLFGFMAVAGRTYRVATSTPARGGLVGQSLVVTLYDPNGNRAAASPVNQEMGTATFKAGMSGRYLVWISSSMGPPNLEEPQGSITEGWATSSGNGEFGASGDRSRGTDYALRVDDTTPPVQKPPRPVRLRSGSISASKGKAKSIVLKFDGALNASKARSLSIYRLVSAGRDKKFGTRDDVVYAIASVKYDARARTVRFTTKKAFVPSPAFRLTVRTNGLLDGNGQKVDGNRDGKAGGDAVLNVGKWYVRFAK